jgi:hypothetical protein
MFVDPPKKSEQILRYVLIALAASLIFLVILAALSMRWIDYPLPGISFLSSSNQEKTEGGDAVATVVRRDLHGSIIGFDPEQAYVRLSVRDDGKIYSVSIPGSVAISRNGTDIDMTELEPLSAVMIRAIELPDTEKYDFLAESVEVTDFGDNPTIEERKAELSRFGRMLSNEN